MVRIQKQFTLMIDSEKDVFSENQVKEIIDWLNDDVAHALWDRFETTFKVNLDNCETSCADKVQNDAFTDIGKKLVKLGTVFQNPNAKLSDLIKGCDELGFSLNIQIEEKDNE